MAIDFMAVIFMAINFYEKDILWYLLTIDLEI